MPITVPQTEANLLAYFQTGDTPTQDQFEELIRTMFYLYNQTVASAAAAAADAAAAEAVATALGPLAKQVFFVVFKASAVPVIYQSNNVASVTYAAGTAFRVNFTAALADTDYAVMVSLEGAPTFQAKTTGYVQINAGGVDNKTYAVIGYKA